MSIYRTSVEHPVTTGLVFLAFAILGVFALTRLPVDNLPDIESNTIMVMSSYPGASAEDVENNLTKVLENTLNGVSDLKNITSNSRENISIITLEFEYGTDIDEATNDDRDKLDMVSQQIPDGASQPYLFKFSVDSRTRFRRGPGNRCRRPQTRNPGLCGPCKDGGLSPEHIGHRWSNCF